MKFGVIYLHRHKSNGKVYVGQTWQNPSRCWRKSDINSYKNQNLFHNALKKYGWDSFESEIIACSKNSENLDRLEEYFMDYFNSLVPNGYNLKSYSEGKETHDESTKKLISKKKTGVRVDHPAWNRVRHMIISGQEYRQCSRCSELKTLDEYHKYTQYTQTKKEYNNNHNYCCKPCVKEYNKKYGYVRKSEDEVKRSYRLRGKRSSKLLKERFKDPKERRKLSLQYCVSYRGINIETREVVEFVCGFDLEEAGFRKAGVSAVCNVPTKSYRGYRWTKTIK